jgi:uncharacterized membrane protein
VAYWLDVSLWAALLTNLALFVFFFVYAFVFQWGFDKVFDVLLSRASQVLTCGRAAG